MTAKISKIFSRIVTVMAMTGLIMCLTVDADAQLRYGFRFGGDFAKASLSSKNLSASSPQVSATAGVGDAKLVNRSGFSGGLVLEYQFEKCGFAPDIAILYTRYNTRLEVPGEKPQSFGRDFIEVPLHLKWKFWIPQTKDLFGPMIYTGPSMMFRVGNNSGLPYSVTSTPAATTQSGDAGGRFKSKTVQPGWDVGIGFDVVNFIQITAGYRFGLGNALDTPDYMTLRTNGWNVAATLLLDF